MRRRITYYQHGERHTQPVNDTQSARQTIDAMADLRAHGALFVSIEKIPDQRKGEK